MAVKKSTAPRKVVVKAKTKTKAKAKAKAAKAVSEPKLPAKVKTKLVRDSFTIPKNEYAVLETLKKRALHLACPAKKSEILRAGINVLNSLPDAELCAAIVAVPNLKTGRPKKAK